MDAVCTNKKTLKILTKRIKKFVVGELMQLRKDFQLSLLVKKISAATKQLMETKHFLL